MKVAIIGTVGVPACYGGYETLVENLLTYKSCDDIEYQVYCSSKAYKTKLPTYKGAKLVYLPLNANGNQAPLYDILSLLHAYATCDRILSLGCSSGLMLPVTKLFSKKKVVVNLDGLDDKREKFSTFKGRILGAWRRLAAKYAHLCISDNQGIVDYAKRVYHRDTVLIEYGGDNAKAVHDDARLMEKYGLAPGEYIFKVARIEPENNIELILKAFSGMPDQKLVVVGNWNKSEFGRRLRQEYGDCRNIIISDPIYEPQELNLLRSNCKLYIHGHSVGGTNPSLVEAMNLGLPIIAYDVVYNRETTENKATYFSDVASLQTAVKSLTSNDDKRRLLSDTMKEIAERRYTWKRIVQCYESAIQSM